MSTKTFFKRAALTVVASLGFGLLSVPSSQAALVTQSLTLSSATSTATVGDSATGSWTLRWTSDTYTLSESNTVTGYPFTSGDTMSVKVGCDAPSGATCPALQARQSATSDTANIVVYGPTERNTNVQTWYNISTNAKGWVETTTIGFNISARSVVSFKAVAFPKVGTYTYTLYASGPSGTAISATSTTWTVTVSAANTTAASALYYLAPTNTQAAWWRGTNGSGLMDSTSRDSSIVALAGTAASPAAVGVMYVVPVNSAGDTRVAIGDTFIPVQDSVSVTLTGPGYVSTAGATPTGKSLTNQNISALLYNQTAPAHPQVMYANESIVVWSDGTAGTATIVVKNSAGTTLVSRTVTFTGAAASIAFTSLSDTYTSIGQAVNLVSQVKDAGSNILTSGTMYVFSSDTKIVSAGATLYTAGSTTKQTYGRCSATWSLTDKTLSCPLTIADTGTASIYLADSWNVSAASFISPAITLTVTGNVIASATVAFDKATYAPGERAVITITTKDIAGNVHAANATGSFAQVYSNYTLTGQTTLPNRGTAGATDNTYGTTPIEYQDTGVETRVVTMPGFTADVNYSVVVPGFGTGAANVVVTATAKVVNPADTAQNTAIANAQAAADAATDAALQAIDAANAATDAANLAAEAADAATVAAQESKDSADAATAAVESLATQVATLMAALQAQITSLANVVAKIAKKVKA